MLKFLLKYILNGAIVVVLMLYYTEITFWGAVAAATGLTVLAYFIGDQLILRGTNNFFATVCDFVMAAGYLWLLSYFFDWSLSFGELLIISLILGVAEWFLHRHVFREEIRV